MQQPKPNKPRAAHQQDRLIVFDQPDPSVLSSSLAFISRIEDEQPATRIRQGTFKAAFSLVQLTGKKYEEITIYYLRDLPVVRAELIKKVFIFAQTKPIGECYCDLETYQWLNADRLWSSMLNAAKQGIITNQYPSLRPFARSAEVKERQLDALSGPLARDEVIPLQEIKADFDSTIASAPNVKADALAGAVLVAQRRRRALLAQDEDLRVAKTA